MKIKTILTALTCLVLTGHSTYAASKTPINNGVLQTDLNGNGKKITNAYFIGNGAGLTSLPSDSVMFTTLSNATRNATAVHPSNGWWTNFGSTYLEGEVVTTDDVEINGDLDVIGGGVSGVGGSFSGTVNGGNGWSGGFRGGKYLSMNGTNFSIGTNGNGMVGKVGFTNGAVQADYIDLLDGVPAYSRGRVFYDTNQETLAVYGDSSDVTMNVGAETWIRVVNKSGSLIEDGKPVAISGAQGKLSKIILASTTNLMFDVVGLATMDIGINAVGYVTVIGVVNDLDTSSFDEGALLYLGTVPGTITTNASRDILGTCAYSHVNQGKILVNVQHEHYTSTTNSTGTALFGGVGIGTNSPKATLHVVGNVIVEGTITANDIASAYATMTMSTGTVQTAASIGPHYFTNFHYVKVSGNIGVLSNAWFVVTNAGDYRLSFGSAVLSGNSDVISLLIYTNHVRFTGLELSATMSSPAIYETGFKEVVIALPAGCLINLASTNSAASAQSMRNTCFNISGAH